MNRNHGAVWSNLTSFGMVGGGGGVVGIVIGGTHFHKRTNQVLLHFTTRCTVCVPRRGGADGDSDRRGPGVARAHAAKHPISGAAHERPRQAGIVVVMIVCHRM